MTTRRALLGGLGAWTVAAGTRAAPARATGAGVSAQSALRPERLRPGDRVALVAPASANFLRSDLEEAEAVVRALGLEPRRGTHAAGRHGYLAGSDPQRAADLNAAFADPSVKGILAIRGGWGCARLLPHLDYHAIGRQPKVLLGYSDVTALLLALQARCGLVTFHGPVALSAWSSFTLEHARQVLFEGQTPTFANRLFDDGRLVPEKYRTRTLHGGRARGRLLGGNLTVLSHLLGSPYLPDWRGAVLFLEDIDEELYRIDRMLTHLALAGVLRQVAAVVFGICTDCEPGSGYGSLTLEEILDDHLRPLGIPCWSGAMIGHIDDQFTLPLGVPVEADAEAATLRLLEPAVR